MSDVAEARIDVGDPLVWLGILVLTAGGTCAGILWYWGWIVQQVRDTKAAFLIARRRRKNKPKPVKVPPVIRRKVHRQPMAPPTSRPTYAPPPRIPTAVHTAVTRHGRTAVVPPPPERTYHRSHSLLTRGEHAFYLVLREAVGSMYHISMKTRLADLVQVADVPHRQRAFNQVAQKHVDFVLSDPHTLRPVLLVELDDKTHRQYQRQRRDKLVNTICWEAGLRILHIKARAGYSKQIIQDIIDDRLRRP